MLTSFLAVPVFYVGRALFYFKPPWHARTRQLAVDLAVYFVVGLFLRELVSRAFLHTQESLSFFNWNFLGLQIGRSALYRVVKLQAAVVIRPLLSPATTKWRAHAEDYVAHREGLHLMGLDLSAKPPAPTSKGSSMSFAKTMWSSWVLSTRVNRLVFSLLLTPVGLLPYSMGMVIHCWGSATISAKGLAKRASSTEGAWGRRQRLEWAQTHWHLARPILFAGKLLETTDLTGPVWPFIVDVACLIWMADQRVKVRMARLTSADFQVFNDQISRPGATSEDEWPVAPIETSADDCSPTETDLRARKGIA